MLDSPDIRNFATFDGEGGRQNADNFFIDQLAAALVMWGQERGKELQMGYMLTDFRVYLVPTNFEAPNVIWIASDSSTGRDRKLGRGLNHYEGLKRGTRSNLGMDADDLQRSATQDELDLQMATYEQAREYGFEGSPSEAIAWMRIQLSYHYVDEAYKGNLHVYTRV